MTRVNRTGLITVLAALLLAGCSRNENLAGGSHTGNTEGQVVSGVVRDADGPLVGVVVTLYPHDFNPVTDQVTESMRAVTDEDGRYRFIELEAGTYNIQALHPETRMAALVRQVEMPGGVQDTQVTAPGALLEPTGSITVHLEARKVERDGYLFLRGTGVHTIITDNHLVQGFINLSRTPSSAYPAVSYGAPDNSPPTSLVEDGLLVQPGEAAVIGPFHAWSDTVKIVINTSATGADIQEDLIGFPLLVRLDGGSGVFASARSDGADLRLTASDGVSILPYEIERWDTSDKEAAIWVRVDTILGQNASQYIMMYSGNAEAGPVSSGPGVFTEEGSFNGVWHLAENGNTDPEGYRDSGPGGYHGSGVSMSGVSDVSGAIGTAQLFDGVQDYIDLNDKPLAVQGNASRTLSAWIRKDGSVSNTIFSTGSSLDTGWAFNLVLYDTISWKGQPESLNEDRAGVMGYDYDFYPESGPQITEGQWHQVTAVYNSGKDLRMYVDGALAHVTETRTNYITTGQHNAIGISNNTVLAWVPYFFQGAIDEVRISSEARSADWIKMNYENQRSGSSVVGVRSSLE